MNILYQDPHLLLCEKPVGLLSEGEGPDSLPAQLAALTGGPVYPVHRLDRGVGGLMVYAKNRRTAAALSEAVRRREMEKQYLCVVSGAPEAPAGTLEDLLYWDAARGKSFPVTRERRGVKRASLSYEVLEGREGLSLLRVTLHTGRTHQIRVQFASRRLPLLGDRKYGGAGPGPIALWSHRLAFRHPVSGEAMDLSLPPPPADPWTLFQK